MRSPHSGEFLRWERNFRQNVRIEALDLKVKFRCGFVLAVFAATDTQLWFLEDDGRTGGDAACDPNTRPDHRVASDDRSSAQDGGVGIDDDVVFDGWVAFLAAYQLPVGIGREAECPERDALIEFDVLADFARLADHHTGSVIDEEVITNRCTGVDVDARLLMGPLGHHSRNEGDVEFDEFVSDPVNRDGFETGIAEHDFVGRLAGRVARKGGFDVRRERRAKFDDAFEQFDGHRLPLRFEIDFVDAIIVLLLDAMFVTQGTADLHGELIVQRVDQSADVVSNVAGVKVGVPPVSGVEDVLEVEQDSDHGLVARQGTVAEMIDRIVRGVRRDDFFGQFGQRFLQSEIGSHRRLTSMNNGSMKSGHARWDALKTDGAVHARSGVWCLG